MAAVQIVPSVLRQQVEEGMKLKPLAEHYNLPVAQMKLALKAQGLTIRKFHAPKFEFVQEVTTEEVVDINVEQEEVLEPQSEEHHEEEGVHIEQEEVVPVPAPAPTQEGW